jgi:hypothetical protein
MDKKHRKRYRVNEEVIDRTPEYWVNIPGFDGLYQANYEGQIRRTLPSGKARPMKLFKKKNSRAKGLFVQLYKKDGSRRTYSVLSLIARTFIGERPEGHTPIHINGRLDDNCAGNIEYVTFHEAGERTAWLARSRPVIKISPSGEIIEAYSSARAAARANYMSPEALTRRCNGDIKTSLDGFIYKWDADRFYQEGRNDKREGSIR